MATSIWFWVGFNAFVLLMLALDLGVFHRRAHEVKLKEAAAWSAVWVTVALLFNVAIYLYAGPQAGLGAHREPDPAAKGEAEGDVKGRKGKAFLYPDLVIVPVQDAKIENQEGGDEAKEHQPHPGRRAEPVGQEE